jgi:hypothetical protein
MIASKSISRIWILGFEIVVCIIIGFIASNDLAAQNATTSAPLTFVWDSNSEPNLAGYRLYQSDTGSGGPFDECFDNHIPPSGGAVVNYPTVVTIGVGQTLCFAVTAYNTAGAESGKSNVVCHTDSTCVPQPAQTQTLSCPTGQTGSITQTRTSTCPGPGYGPWVTTSNTCKTATACVPTTETRSSACPGQTGTITESRTSTCPSPTGSPVWGAWTQTSNTCRTLSTCTTHTETRTVKCSSWWYKGSTTQQRTSTCQNGQEVWGAWVTTSSTCRPLWQR